MRGINDNIVIFSIKKRDLNTKYYKDNKCDNVLKSFTENGYMSLAYYAPVDISRAKYEIVKLANPTEAPAGCSFVTRDGKIGVQIDNLELFEQSFEDEFNKHNMKDKESARLGIEIKDFEHYKTILESITNTPFIESIQEGMDFVKEKV
jgi:hypothetical protein